MTTISPVSFKNQQSYNPSEYYLVRKPSQEDMSAMRKRRNRRLIGSSAIWAAVWTGVEAVMTKAKKPVALAKSFGLTFGVFAVASLLVNAVFNRKN